VGRPASLPLRFQGIPCWQQKAAHLGGFFVAKTPASSAEAPLILI
jgi:hypothetical protein